MLWFFFTSPNKQLENDLRLKLNEKRPAEENLVKYLENQIDKNLAWKKQVNYVAIKLYEANVRISKLKHVLDEKNSEQFTIQYLNPNTWTQNVNSVKRIHMLQKTFLRIMYSQSQNFYTCSLIKDSKNFKYFDETALENCIF